MIKSIVPALFFVSLSFQAKSDVLLTINVSDSSAVAFISTLANSDNNYLDVANTFYGVSLLGFFSEDIGDQPEFVGFGDITVFDANSDTRRTLYQAYAVNRLINFSDEFGIWQMSFLDTEPALGGSAILDLSALGKLPEIGEVGDIVVGTPNGAAIGQWEVVPEPSVAWLVLAAAIAFTGFVRPRNISTGSMVKHLSLVLFLVPAPTKTNAEVIMTVDLSDPSAAIFSTTTANAQNTFMDGDPNLGITLLGFFSGNTQEIDRGVGQGSIDVFDSSAGTTRSPLSDIFIGEFPGGWTIDDLNFYSFLAFFGMNFLASQRALAGSVTEDLSATTNLPGVGSMGDIVAGDPDLGQVIGQWEVVPGPSAAWSILGAAIGLFAIFRIESRSRLRAHVTSFGHLGHLC